MSSSQDDIRQLRVTLALGFHSPRLAAEMLEYCARRGDPLIRMETALVGTGRTPAMPAARSYQLVNGSATCRNTTHLCWRSKGRTSWEPCTQTRTGRSSLTGRDAHDPSPVEGRKKVRAPNRAWFTNFEELFSSSTLDRRRSVSAGIQRSPLPRGRPLGLPPASEGAGPYGSCGWTAVGLLRGSTSRQLVTVMRCVTWW
jgi:hypothetical protein